MAIKFLHLCNVTCAEYSQGQTILFRSGRVVKRGERALTLCMPITRKQREEESDEEHTFTSFAYKPRWFVLGQTQGRELEPTTIPEWDSEKAIAALSMNALLSIRLTETVKVLLASVR